MTVKYLKELQANSTLPTSGTPVLNTIEGISLDEIASLETIYNNGNHFPTVLKELFFLAGKYCYLLDYGLTDSQAEMQQDVRGWLQIHNRLLIRPFTVIDVYNGPDGFLFVYLDEGIDPIVYSAFLPVTTNESLQWLKSLNVRLSRFISNRLQKVLSGYNPF
ncbi:hypothetical protein G7092_01495 [Mucilaginibacter sp. HC2]|uniref:hypothetical protein n=1 Tax=Mucilaginibacter inviolabilis TaxID=2714892 RepID=UPI00140DDC0A|nr:hypothetical protein [Mucilaginibacter inviolabilis]NHA02446.1 hypothetical protein [Mucilaginibacter inviolabilis]